MSRAILVTGATGNQGGAMIDALLSSPNSTQYTLLAVTRNPSSASAQKVAAKSPNTIKLVQGDFEDVPALFKSAEAALLKTPSAHNPSIWGVYSVQIGHGSGQNPESERRYGQALIDGAISAGVEHFVYSSVDRGGEQRSWENPTYVPHFASKHALEHYLVEKTAAQPQGQRMTWTILRPVGFMDQVTPAFQTKVFMTAMRDTALGGKNSGRKMQWVACRDIGRVGAMAFDDPQAFAGKAVGVAGDATSWERMDEIFTGATGRPTPTTFGVLGKLLNVAVKEFGLMLRWFNDEGFNVDVAACRRLIPDMKDFETHVRDDSGFATGGK